MRASRRSCSATRERAIERALADPREPFADALRAGLEALEHLWELRQGLPREQVPPVLASAWIRHLERFRDGDWADARAAADEKLGDPAI